MGGTVVGECRKCGIYTDIDPLLENTYGNRLCGDCQDEEDEMTIKERIYNG